MIASAYASVNTRERPGQSRTQPDSTQTAPDRVSAGQGPFGVVVAGGGFEPP